MKAFFTLTLTLMLGTNAYAFNQCTLVDHENMNTITLPAPSVLSQDCANAKILKNKLTVNLCAGHVENAYSIFLIPENADYSTFTYVDANSKKVLMSGKGYSLNCN